MVIFEKRTEFLDELTLAEIVGQLIEQQTIILNMDNNKEKDNAKDLAPSTFAQTYFHGTKADLNLGDFIEVGYNSNFGQRKNAKYIFLAATLDPAIWGLNLLW